MFAMIRTSATVRRIVQSRGSFPKFGALGRLDLGCGKRRGRTALNRMLLSRAIREGEIAILPHK